jgi:hypothetical protein
MATDDNGKQNAPAFFDIAALAGLNAKLSHPDGIDVAELLALLDEHFGRSRSAADVQAFREGRKPWK